MKLVYMGTPDYAVPPLKALYDAGHEISAVVTQPDKPVGRGRKIQECPVKVLAKELGLPVFQPERIKRAEAVEELKKYEADIFVVAAFGQILSREILMMPRFGCVNIHASLLPRYRGASPIQSAVLNGDEESGVTIMQMDEGIDTGDILFQRSIKLSEDETGGSLFDRLSTLGAELITEALPAIERGDISPLRQDEEAATHTKMINKEEGRISFMRDAKAVERQIRAMNPWPSAFTFLGGKQLKIWAAKAETDKSHAVPGTVLFTEKDSFTVACGSGTLKILELQLEGKKRMGAGDFLRGLSLNPGDRLGQKE
ncbi:MAG: methionyl-tRNA formyltransferase [Lachnospiraceae bacterium]|nr:methionyl-tRNA formyltransferase [Lachnospiraceae bacterium]